MRLWKKLRNLDLLDETTSELSKVQKELNDIETNFLYPPHLKKIPKGWYYCYNPIKKEYIAEEDKRFTKDEFIYINGLTDVGELFNKSFLLAPLMKAHQKYGGRMVNYENELFKVKSIYSECVGHYAYLLARLVNPNKSIVVPLSKVKLNSEVKADIQPLSVQTDDSLTTKKLKRDIIKELMKNEGFREAMKITIEATVRMCTEAAKVVGEILADYSEDSDEVK